MDLFLKAALGAAVVLILAALAIFALGRALRRAGEPA